MIDAGWNNRTLAYHIEVLCGATYWFYFGIFLQWIVLYPFPNGGLSSEVPLAFHLLDTPSLRSGASVASLLFTGESNVERPSDGIIADMNWR